MAPRVGDFVQRWAFTSVRSPVRRVRYETEDRWSAASEGVLAALRLSKSTQSADKVHFSDSAELSIWSSRKRCAVSIVSGHNRSLLRIINQTGALFITVGRKARSKIVFIGREFTNPEPTSLITLPASATSPMTEDFARDHGNGSAMTRRARYLRASSAAWRSASMRLRSSAMPLPAMSKAVPWSTEVLTTGRPTVMFTPDSRPSTLMGPWPWS